MFRRYTGRQEARFKASYARKKQFQVALVVPVGGALFLLASSRYYVADLGLQTMALGTVGLLLAAAGFSWFNWRCPACKRYLGNNLSPRHCPKCGVALRSH